MRLLICAGGTGGGVYPALAVLQAVMASHEPGSTQEMLWVGGEGGMEADLVKRAGVPFETISAAGVHGVGARNLPGNIARLVRGYRKAQRILQDFRPEVLFFTGGYVAVPLALAGRHIPTLLYVPDIEPGLALKTLARFADRIAVTAEESRQYFPKKAGQVVVTGYPTRPELLAWDADKARQALGLSKGLPTLLVFGGSKGARSINRALMGVLPELLKEMQVVHISGELDWPEVQAAAGKLDASQAERYRAFPYLHAEMGAALSIADLVVSRAGASVLGEFPLFGLPAILVPYPYAWRYQRVNAEYLTRQGAAEMLRDEDLSTGLLPAVRRLMNDPSQRERMRQAMRSLRRPAAAQAIAEQLFLLSGSRRLERT